MFGSGSCGTRTHRTKRKRKFKLRRHLFSTIPRACSFRTRFARRPNKAPGKLDGATLLHGLGARAARTTAQTKGDQEPSGTRPGFRKAGSKNTHTAGTFAQSKAHREMEGEGIPVEESAAARRKREAGKGGERKLVNSRGLPRVRREFQNELARCSGQRGRTREARNQPGDTNKGRRREAAEDARYRADRQSAEVRRARERAAMQTEEAATRIKRRGRHKGVPHLAGKQAQINTQTIYIYKKVGRKTTPTY